jgi:FixJ family two-component response regulator
MDDTLNPSIVPMVFIVDDSDEIRDSLAAYFRVHGIEVEAYASTEEFVRSYRPRRYSCLVLDHHLRDSTGIEFLVSSAFREINIPVVMITASTSTVIKHRALEAGAAGFLQKPLNLATLLAVIYSAVNRNCR